MYTLYFLPSACSLATQVVLNELQQPLTLIQKQDEEDFAALNPAGTVPVLIDGEQTLNEGVAILLHLLNKHDNTLLPQTGTARQQAIENMLFANATMHPAYSKLFFIQNTIVDDQQKQLAFSAVAQSINQLWQVVESRLGHQPYLGGEHLSAADIMLAVYSRWGQFFPVEIILGERTQVMLAKIFARPSFKLALQREQEYSRDPALAS